MFDQARGPSDVSPSAVTDSDIFESITGRPLTDRSVRRRPMGTASELHHHQRKQFEAMPYLGDVCEHLAAMVKAEKRSDHALALRDLCIDSTGALSAPGRGEIVPGASQLGMMEQAWAQLVSRAPRRIPARMRTNVNAWLRDSTGTGVARTMEAPSGRARECFALVSERYQPHDADEVAHEVARALPSECRGQVKYLGDGGRYEVDAVIARPFDVDGDVHRIVISLRSGDQGIMSQQLWLKALRLRCTNGMFIADKALMARVWHKGEVSRLRDQFAQGLVMARAAIESFSTHWRRAQVERFVDSETGATLSGVEALNRLVGRGDIAVPQVDVGTLSGHLLTAWEAEPGDSVADVLNAITRAGHTVPWAAPWVTESLEESAGQLLYGAAYALPALTMRQAQALAA